MHGIRENISGQVDMDWSTRNITDEMVNEYLEHHRRKKVMIIQISFSNEIKRGTESPS